MKVFGIKLKEKRGTLNYINKKQNRLEHILDSI